MTFTTRRSAIAAIGAAAVAGVAAPRAWAQAGYPNRPVKMIVPFGAGSSPDIIARYLAQKLQERMGQPFVIDNKAGAGGALGAEAGARSAPDGYTVIFMVNSIVTMNPFIYKKLGYDAARDFAPVTLLTAVPYVLLANKDFGAKTLKDLIAMAKAKPGGIDYASAGVGGAGHVIMELMCSLAGIQMTHIPYKTDGLAAVIGGQVPLMLQPTTTSVPLVKQGKLLGLGTTSTKRLAVLPDVPPIADVVPGFAADGWQGLMAPAGTPPAIVERLRSEVAAVLALPETTERLLALAIDAWPSTPQQMQATIVADTAKWGKVIADARIEAQ